MPTSETPFEWRFAGAPMVTQQYMLVEQPEIILHAYTFTIRREQDLSFRVLDLG